MGRFGFWLGWEFSKFYLPKSKAKSHTSLEFLAWPGDPAVFASSAFEVSGLLFSTAGRFGHERLEQRSCTFLEMPSTVIL